MYSLHRIPQKAGVEMSDNSLANHNISKHSKIFEKTERKIYQMKNTSPVDKPGPALIQQEAIQKHAEIRIT